jgi:phosphotransferase system IIB component
MFLGSGPRQENFEMHAGEKIALRALADEGKLDDAKLTAANVQSVMRLPNKVVHLIVGAEAKQYAAALEEQLK